MSPEASPEETSRFKTARVTNGQPAAARGSRRDSMGRPSQAPEPERRIRGSSSGPAAIRGGVRRQETDLAVGRALQRAWGDLTREGLAAQPMMSLLVLENIADHGRAGELSGRTRRTVAACSRQLRVLAPEIGSGRPAFLLRFGHAAPPTGRAGRLPPSVSTRAPAGPIDAIGSPDRALRERTPGGSVSSA